MLILSECKAISILLSVSTLLELLQHASFEMYFPPFTSFHKTVGPHLFTLKVLMENLEVFEFSNHMAKTTKSTIIVPHRLIHHIDSNLLHEYRYTEILMLLLFFFFNLATFFIRKIYIILEYPFFKIFIFRISLKTTWS